MQKIQVRMFLPLLLPLFLALPAAGSDKNYEANRVSYYVPQLLPSVDDAASKIMFLQPHIYQLYGKMAIVSTRVTVDKNGINVFFSNPVNPGYDDYTVSIQFASAASIESNLSHFNPGYYYVKVGCTDSSPFVYTDSIERAHMLEDAILTLEVASGKTNLFSSDFDLDGLPAKVVKSLNRDIAFYALDLQRGGPAETAGLKNGDILVGVNGASARGVWSTIGNGVLSSPTGYTVHLSLLRDKKPVEIDVTYKSLWTAQQVAALSATDPNANHADAAPAYNPVPAPAPVPAVFLGVRAHNILASEAQAAGLTEAQGIFVDQIAPGSLAEQASIKPGDVILALDGKPALTLEQMRAILQQGAPSNIKVWRKGAALSLVVSQSL
jgi:hypothetical protein